MQSPSSPHSGQASDESTFDSALVEVRIAGRGGQGVVTAGELLGEAALRSGRHAQSLPTFGPERRGALAQCTLRVGDKPILHKCSTAEPSVVACLDPTIWRHAPITLGVREDAVLIINTTQSASALETALRSGDFPSSLRLERFTVHTLDATAIAMEWLGRPISNTTMLGALVGASDVVGFEDIERVLRGRFGAAGESNVQAARAGFEAVGGRDT